PATQWSRLVRAMEPCPAWLTADWNKYDDRLMKAAERGDVEKILSVLAKKGVNPTKLDLEGRSAFHVVASKGNLDCLNALLLHGVDIIATDIAGRTALHLAAKYGHALCLQKLLQYNCSTENVDLQGRTALHDAAMSDCTSSIQLLCDHGAAVNARDADGRTPLVLATQMCRPTICQFLLDRGAEVNARDKQNRTALMLGCEYGCKDAVEVLLKNGADVTLVDALGHDCFYYARIGDSTEILSLIKAAFEESRKGTSVPSMLPKWTQPSILDEVSNKPFLKEHQNVQELERENEDLKGRMREIQQEQRIFLDRINGLQLQLNEVTSPNELRRLLATKEQQQEESLRMLEALKSKLRFHEQILALAPANLQSRSMVRPLELLSPTQGCTSEADALKRELSSIKSCYEAAKGDLGRLQAELSHKTAECKALDCECERIKQESDQQIKQLEDALKDVQKRMFDSEGKVKQMQTHFLALKDHLTSEAAAGSTKGTEELKEQLKDMKAKYEGASAEVGKLRNQLKQNELLVEEFRRDEARLVEENKKLQKGLGMLKVEREKRERTFSEAEEQLKETTVKLANKFEKMKSSLSSEIDEKDWKLAELEKEREKLCTEVQHLRTELEKQKAQLAHYVKPEEHKHVRSRYEQRARELEKGHLELKQKNQALQKALERAQVDHSLLKQQMETLRAEVKTQYVPVKVNEDTRKVVGELNKKVTEATEKYHRYKGEVEKLLAEKLSLQEKISKFQTIYIPPEKHEKEIGVLKSTLADLQKQLNELNQRYEKEQAKVSELVTKNAALREVMKEQYVSSETHEEAKTALNIMLERTGEELSDLKEKMEKVKQECLKVNEENGALKQRLRGLQSQMQAEYLSTKDHDSKVAALNATIQDLQRSNSAMQAKYQEKQEEVAQLHAEIEAQKKEIDLIQECIKSKYAPLASLDEKKRDFEATVVELKNQLLEQGEQLRIKEEEIQKHTEEIRKLTAGILTVQNDLQENYILAEKYHAMEGALAAKADDLSKELRELQQRFAEVTGEKERLQEESARQRSEVLLLQSRLQGQYVPREQVEALERKLSCTIEGLKVELDSQASRNQQELQRAQALQQELAHLQATSVPLAEHSQIRARLEKEMAALQSGWREKEEENQARKEEVSRLHSDLQSTKQALSKLEKREVVEASEHKRVRSRLEGQVSSMAEKLAELTKKMEKLQDDSLKANAEEPSPRDEKELLQPRNVNIEQEIKDQKERCDKSLSTIVELQKRIQESAKQVEAKDNKITELLNDVERLKQALHGLSQLTHNIPAQRQIPQMEVLQNQVKTLQQQLADAERQHQEVISIYRTHLLSAVQGHMDEDVQAALLQIIRMRQGLIC
uniref:Uveal autoantigen with coiled-coil domains and ankyrin repeats n=1 Tax=Pseudonaja textilis TaxID=8673 RepID=A0A670ZH33_PSETE